MGFVWPLARPCWQDFRGGACYKIQGVVEKQHILSEIKRTAEANGGVALGMGRFHQETGIRVSDWKGKFWVRWGDALREAGVNPNRFGTEPHDHTFLIEKFITLARELGHLPSRWELQMKHHQQPGFPHPATFSRSLGSKGQIAAKVRDYCAGSEGYDDLLALMADIADTAPVESPNRTIPEEDLGFVYLIKSGRYCKIGRSNSAGRREYELAIQLPEKATLVHTIRTDDAAGIEAYWHKRFSAKRKGGEWFELNADDVRAFKRRKKFM